MICEVHGPPVTIRLHRETVALQENLRSLARLLARWRDVGDGRRSHERDVIADAFDPQ